MKSINLNIPERLHLLQVLPEKGNYVTIKILNDLRMKIALTSDEVTEYNIKESNGSITWDETGLKEIEMTFEDAQFDLIKTTVKDLDEKKDLQFSFADLYAKILD